MHKLWRDLLPYYAAGQLPAAERLALEEHLLNCHECRAALDEWRALAEAVRADAGSRSASLPTLSPQLYRAQQDSPGQMPSTSSDRRGFFLRKWNIEQRVTLVKPSHWDEEDKDMYTAYDVSLQPARPFSGARKLKFDPLAWVAALIIMIVLSAVLLYMRSLGSPIGGSESLQPEYAAQPTQEKCPPNLDQLQMGQAALDGGDYPAAIEAFTCAIEADPHNLEAYLGRGSAYLLAGDLTRAQHDYYLVAVGNPSLLEEAIIGYGSAIEANPNDITAYIRRYYAEFLRGPAPNRRQIRDDGNRIVELKPEWGPGYAFRGLGYGMLGDRQQMGEDFARAVELAPDNPTLYWFIAEGYVIQPELTDSSLKSINLAIELDPERSDNYLLRADTYARMGADRLAAADYARYIEMIQTERIVQNLEVGSDTTLSMPVGRVYSITFRAKAGQSLSVSALHVPRRPPWPWPWSSAVLVLLAEDGTPLVGADDFLPSLQSYISRFTIPADGTYTVLVTRAIPLTDNEIKVTVTLTD